MKSAERTFSYRHQLAELSRLAEDLEAYGEANGINPGIINSFNLCLDEVLTNIISYAYRKVPAPEGPCAELVLRLDGEHMEAEMRDWGSPFNPLEDAPEPDLDSPLEEREVGGLGVFFCREMMDQLSYQREQQANVLTLRKNAQPAGLQDLGD